MTESQDMPMLWVDIETTGLDQYDLHAQILEFGYVITDSKLEVIDRDSWIIENRSLDPLAYDEFIQDFHGPDKTNLLELSANGGTDDAGNPRGQVTLRGTWETLSWVDTFMAETICKGTIFGGELPMLHGSSIQFDRKWIEAFMPKLTKALHHRSIDLSSVMELAKRWAPQIDMELSLTPKKTHRVDDDLDDSIDLAALYRNQLFDQGQTTWTS